MTIATYVLGLGALLIPKININTNALGFIRGTDIYETMSWIKQDGRLGSDVVEVGVQGRDFIKIDSFIQDLESLPGTIETTSIIDAIKDVGGEPTEALEDIEESGMSPIILDSLRSANAIKITVFTNQALQSLPLSRFISQIRKLGERHRLELFLGGKTVTWALQERQIREGKIQNTIIEIFLLIIWGALFTRVIRLGLILVAPLLFASAVIIIALVWLNIDFNQGVAVIMAFAINAAADFMFFPIAKFLELKNIPKTMDQTSGIILKDAGVNMVLFAPLLLAQFAPIQQLGLIIIVMLAATAAGVRLLVPCLLPLAQR